MDTDNVEQSTVLSDPMVIIKTTRHSRKLKHGHKPSLKPPTKQRITRKLATKKSNRSAASEIKIAPVVSSKLSKWTGPFRRSRRIRKQLARRCKKVGAGFHMVPGYANNNESPGQKPSSIFDSDHGFFDTLFQTPVTNFAN